MRGRQMSTLKTTIANKISSLTRFDLQNIQVLSEKSENVPVKLNFTQKFNYFKQINIHPNRFGHKSVTTVECSSTAQIESGLANELLVAQNNTSSAVSQWVKYSTPSFKKTLQRNDMFTQVPKLFFRDLVCTNCNGNKTLKCSTCSGGGKVQCYSCYGSRRQNCSNCSGMKRQRCISCSGYGYKERIELKPVWNPTISNTETVSVTERDTCYSCSGSGETVCMSCDSLGKVSCTTCSGMGDLSCSKCSGIGHEDCNKCIASGFQHELGMVDVQFTQAEQYFFDSSDPKLLSLISTVSTQKITHHFDLASVSYQEAPFALITHHQLTLPVSTLNFSVENQEFTVYGFGPQNQVYDYDNVVGCILENDLEDLESKASQASSFLYSRSRDFAKSMSQFFDSEVNASLLSKFTSNEFENVINENYISRAMTAINSGLSKYAQSVFIAASSLLSAIIILGLDFYCLAFVYDPRDTKEEYVAFQSMNLTESIIMHVILYILLAFILIPFSFWFIRRKCGLNSMKMNEIEYLLSTIGFQKKKVYWIFIITFTIIEAICNRGIIAILDFYLKLPFEF